MPISTQLTASIEHDGLKQDGTPDGRVGTGEFAHGQVDPHEAGKAGGQTSGSGSSGSDGSSGGDNYKPTGTCPCQLMVDISNSDLEHGGLKQDGTPDGRVGTGGM